MQLEASAPATQRFGGRFLKCVSLICGQLNTERPQHTANTSKYLISDELLVMNTNTCTPWIYCTHPIS